MSSNAKSIFANIGYFLCFIVSWWVIGATVSGEAVRNDGRFFDTQSVLLAGAYYNDWLPVITAVAFGLGWCIAVLVTSLGRTNSQPITFQVLFLIFGTVACFPVLMWVRNIAPVFENDFVDPSFPLFLSGIVNGIGFSLLRKFERSND